MKISGVVVRRALGAAIVVGLLASSTACGSSSSGASPSSKDAGASPSASPSSGSGATADGRCGSGSFRTQVVRAAQGVRVTVPADWDVRSEKAGAAIRFYLPGGADGDGYLVVQRSKQTLAQVVADTQKSTRAEAEVESESRPSLSGFDAALATSFRYGDAPGTAFSVNVVAVGDGLRVLANMAGDRNADERAAALSCLSSLSRGR